jgi:uncharacterized protein YggE
MRTIALLALLAAPLLARAAPPAEPRITSSGVGTVSRPPDRAVVSVGATVQAPTSAKAQADLNATVDRVIKAVKALGIESLVVQTQAISLSPVYDYGRRGEETPRVVGYRASNILRVRVDDTSRIGPVIDTAIAAGANELHGISFELKDDAPARREALALAARDARDKAHTLALALGLTIAGVAEATVGTPQVYPVWQQAMEARAPGSPMAAPTPVEAGDVTVTAQVTVVFIARPDR